MSLSGSRRWKTRRISGRHRIFGTTLTVRRLLNPGLINDAYQAFIIGGIGIERIELFGVDVMYVYYDTIIIIVKIECGV